jgi:hypothetical protein
MTKKPTEIVPTMLRIREDLRKRLEREAKKRDHSLNAEMMERLEASFAKDAKELRDSAIVDMLVDHDSEKGNAVRVLASEIARTDPKVLGERIRRAREALSATFTPVEPGKEVDK